MLQIHYIFFFRDYFYRSRSRYASAPFCFDHCNNWNQQKMWTTCQPSQSSIVITMGRCLTVHCYFIKGTIVHAIIIIFLLAFLSFLFLRLCFSFQCPTSICVCFGFGTITLSLSLYACSIKYAHLNILHLKNIVREKKYYQTELT